LAPVLESANGRQKLTDFEKLTSNLQQLVTRAVYHI
jgi:hypothetical protein